MIWIFPHFLSFMIVFPTIFLRYRNLNFNYPALLEFCGISISRALCRFCCMINHKKMGLLCIYLDHICKYAITPIFSIFFFISDTVNRNTGVFVGQGLLQKETKFTTFISSFHYSIVLFCRINVVAWRALK